MATYKTKHDRKAPKKEKTAQTAIQCKPPEEDVAVVESFSLLWMARNRAIELGRCFVCEIVLKNCADPSKPAFRFFVSKSLNKITIEREYFQQCGILVNWKMIRQ